MDWIYYVIIGLVAVLFLLVGYFARQLLANQQIRNAQNEAKKLLESAQVKYEQMVLDAKEEAVKVRAAAEADSRERRYELQRLERRSSQREERLERKLEALDRRERSLVGREKEIDTVRAAGGRGKGTAAEAAGSDLGHVQRRSQTTAFKCR